MAPSIHYENRQYTKEHEANANTTHRIGRDGSVVSRSRSRARSVLQGGPNRRSVSEVRPAHHQSSPCSKYQRRQSHHESHHSHHSHPPHHHSHDHSHDHSHHSHSSKHSDKSQGSKRHVTGRERCFVQPWRAKPRTCNSALVWEHGKYARDECGSGIVPKRFDFKPSRKIWCKTPLTMYQATIGELGRQILCREKIVPRDVFPEPPCNISEYILPPCKGYYRKYDCIRPCEEEYVRYKNGVKTYRDRVERYWEPCLSREQKSNLDINTYAGHNVYLGIRMRRKNVDIPCW